jgi:hypothetical protein
MMFMLHHHLHQGRRPMDALRAAQLWMLDPSRAVPPEMPAALAAEASRPELAHISAWAAFTHQGQ